MASPQDSKSVAAPRLGPLGWLRWIWTQLTSMKTALLLLLLLAAAAIPGSVFPQRSADPNGVRAFFKDSPEVAKALDTIQLFDVYTSSWFSAIYILLFISLIGCVIPRTMVHAKALFSPPPKTPSNLARMPAFLAVSKRGKNADLIERAEALLRRQGYRVVLEPAKGAKAASVSAERGYLRETGNLTFHVALIGVLFAVGIGGGFSYSGQRVLVEGETFVNNLASFDSFAPGALFDETQLTPFSMRLDKFEAIYDLQNPTNVGTPLDFRATVTTLLGGTVTPRSGVIRVNEPLELPNANVYLTGNGFAPAITVRDASGAVSFSGPVAFLPQDSNLTSLGVIKVPDAQPDQFGILAFFYPTAVELENGALTSYNPEVINPLMTMNVYVGDLGLDDGAPKNAYALDVQTMTQVAGGKSGVKGLRLEPGETVELPKGLGTVSFDGLKRFASLDISYNPGGIWVLAFALLALGGVALSLTVPRRRVWVKQTSSGFEIAALARGDDPTLEKVIADVAAELKS